MKRLLLFVLVLVLTDPAAAQSAAAVAMSAQPNAAIPDNAYRGVADGNDGTGEDAGMVCVDLDFSGQPETPVTTATLSIGLTHSWVGDLTIKIKSPAGAILPVLARPLGDLTGEDILTDDGTGCCGDSSGVSGDAPLLFQDGGPRDAESLGLGVDDIGTACLDDGVCVFAPNPSGAAGGPGGITTFAGFGGESSVGIWSVCVGDAVSSDIGRFDTVTLTLGSGPVAVEEDASGTFAVGLLGANPFRTATALGVRVTTPQRVRATLHDLLGREVATLFDGAAVASAEMRIAVDAAGLPSGSYMVRVAGETFSATQSLTVAR